MSEINDELFKLELAAHMPARGEDPYEWARNNPDAEYSLWMTAHCLDEDVESQMAKRVRIAEKCPGFAKVQAVVAGTIGLLAEGGAAEVAVRDGKIGVALAVGVAGLYPLVLSRDIIKNGIPTERAVARKEQEMFKKGMQALKLAKMSLKAETN